MSVQPDIGSLSDPLKFDEYFFIPTVFWQSECLVIPHDGITQLCYRDTESFIFVERSGQGDLRVMGGNWVCLFREELFRFQIANVQTPSGIKIIASAYGFPPVSFLGKRGQGLDQ